MRVTEQRGTLRAGGLHHRANVVAPLLERRQRREWNGIRESGATLVEAEHSAERAETREKRRDRRLLPHDLDVRRPPRNEDEVTRSVADDLVGNAAVLGARVSCLGNLHGGSGSEPCGT